MSVKRSIYKQLKCYSGNYQFLHPAVKRSRSRGNIEI